MPLDGDPEDIENTGISTNTITNYLRSCGADNAVMILDACRSGGKKSGEGIGRQTEAEARQTGVISFFSCSPDQYSYELEAIGQGAFTYAFLEGLGIRGKCATVERLNQYLEHRVPALVSQHLSRVRQIPYTIAEPVTRSHLILISQHATLTDIATLKNDAYQAEVNQDFSLAEQLWIRVLAAASGQDVEAVKALQRMEHSRLKYSREYASSITTQLPTTLSSSWGKSGNSPLRRFTQVKNKLLVGFAVLVIGFGGYQTYSYFSQLPANPKPHNATSPNLTEISTDDLASHAAENFNQGNVENGQRAVETLLDRGATQQAFDALNSVPVRYSDDANINFLRGRAVWQSFLAGNPSYSIDDARRYWEVAVENKPDPHYYNALGFAYYAQGKLDIAEQMWLRSLQLLGQDQNRGNEQRELSQEALTGYAGLALVSTRFAQQQTSPEKAKLVSEAIKLRQKILTEDPVNFQPDMLARNWLWSEAAIQDWRSLLNLK